MKLKLIKKKSKMNIILNVIVGILLMSFAVLFFDYKKVDIVNWIVYAIFFFFGLISIISTIKNRKKDVEKTENNVITWLEEKA